MPRALADIAQEYVAGVGALFRPAAGRAERAAAALVASPELHSRASVLLVVSEEFNAAGAAEVRGADPAAREAAALRLLAKAHTDLELAQLLLEADRATGEQGAVRAPDRSSSAGELLDSLKDVVEPEAPQHESRGARTGGPEEAKRELGQAVGVTLRAVADHAAKGGRQAMEGIATQGFAQVTEIAGRLGMAAADVVGVGDGIRWLVRLARRFIARAYEAILGLFGAGAVQACSRKLAEWVTYLTGDGFRGFVSDTLYGVGATEAALSGKIDASAAPVERLTAARQAVDALDPAFQRHTRLAGQLMNGLDNFAGYVTTVFHDLRLAVAVTYALTGGYVLLAGADYTDATDWRLFDRVAGVRRTVEAAIS
jgi:hypothetical protein